MRKSMHIAFEAARFLETEAVPFLSDDDCIIDADVDEQDNPFVLITVGRSIFADIINRIPESLTVLGQKVSVIVKPLDLHSLPILNRNDIISMKPMTMRMN